MVPIDYGELPDFGILPAIRTPRNERDWQELARKLGVNRWNLGDNVESCKQAAGVPNYGNVQIDDDTGNIFYEGEWIGNARDGC